MSDPFLGEVRVFGFGYAPAGWALCNGQALSTSQYRDLFSLLGTTYGGDGVSHFRLPDLQGRAVMHRGGGYTQGQQLGEATHTLIPAEMPSHSHAVGAVRGGDNNSGTPSASSYLGNAGAPAYGPAPGDTIVASIGPPGVAGANQPHPNMQPYLTVNFCIALTGIYPSPN